MERKTNWRYSIDTCRAPLPYKPIFENNPHPVMERVMFFNPKPVFDRIILEGLADPFKRMNTLSIGALFPDREDRTCSCGCGPEEAAAG